MAKRKTITRRKFLGSAAAAGAGLMIVPRHVLGGREYTPPSGVITRGVIGTGGQGMGAHVATNAEGQPPVCLAVCDVDRQRRERALAKAQRSCEAYNDFRRVLDRRDIDTIHIATPPHWHALVCIAAAQAGKDILCEKPMTKFIAEGQAVIDAVRANGRVFQIGTYARFGQVEGFGSAALLRKVVASGVLGTPLTIRVANTTGYNWKVRMWSGRTDLPPQPVPDVLDYDFWQGPAPSKPYHPHRVHGSFRGYWDYDGGGLADMGQHYLDPIQYVLNKDDTSPVEVWADAPPAHPDACGLWARVWLRYEDGTTIILGSGEWGQSEPEGSPFMEGPNGKLYRGYRTDPPGLVDAVRDLPDPPRLRNFHQCVRTRQQPGGHEGSSHRSATLLHLANAAIRTGRRLRYDPSAQRFINDDQANRLVDIPMRAPWRLT